MTATTHSPTLREVAERHEAAAGRPSMVYRAGGVLTAESWSDHARTLAHSTATRIARECTEFARAAGIYGLAGRVVETIEERP